MKSQTVTADIHENVIPYSIKEKIQKHFDFLAKKYKPTHHIFFKTLRTAQWSPKKLGELYLNYQ